MSTVSLHSAPYSQSATACLIWIGFCAVLEFLNDDCKREYLVAMETVPELVQTETPLTNFLRTEDYNAIKACRRLAMYWKHRHRVFGEERWLLPLNQMDSGALSSSTIEIIRSGCLWIVTEPTPLVVVDSTRLNRQFTNADGLEWLFYFGSVISNEKSQTTGVTVIHRIAEGQRIQLVGGQFELSQNAMPFKFGQPFMVSTLDQSKPLLADFLTLQMAKMVEFHQHCQPFIINTTSVEERLQILEQKGISRHSLPNSLGGQQGEEYWRNWISARINVENLMGSIVRNRAALFLDDEPKENLLARAGKKRATRSKGVGNDKEAVRRRNALHHQRWLKKERIRRNALHEKSKLETNRNAQLKAMNENLTSLLAQANYVVALHKSNRRTKGAAASDDDDDKLPDKT